MTHGSLEPETTEAALLRRSGRLNRKHIKDPHMDRVVQETFRCFSHWHGDGNMGQNLHTAYRLGKERYKLDDRIVLHTLRMVFGVGTCTIWMVFIGDKMNVPRAVTLEQADTKIHRTIADKRVIRARNFRGFKEEVSKMIGFLKRLRECNRKRGLDLPSGSVPIPHEHKIYHDTYHEFGDPSCDLEPDIVGDSLMGLSEVSGGRLETYGGRMEMMAKGKLDLHIQDRLGSFTFDLFPSCGPSRSPLMPQGVRLSGKWKPMIYPKQ